MYEELQRVTGLEEYQKELAVLMQEHEQTGDHQAYMTKTLELLTKYIPNYQAYYTELMGEMAMRKASTVKKA